MDPSVVDCTFSLELSCRQVGGGGLVIISKQNVSIKLEPVKVTAKENQKIKKRDVKTPEHTRALLSSSEEENGICSYK